jgi:hypothetical protein
MADCKHRNNMGEKHYYSYEGKNVGVLTKIVSSVVMVEQDWVDALNHEFANNGYLRLFGGIEKTLRGVVGENLTDAQLWTLAHHITNQGVPQALRDLSADEKSAPVKFVRSAASMVTEKVDASVNVVSSTASVVGETMSKPFRKTSDESDDEDIPEATPP